MGRDLCMDSTSGEANMSNMHRLLTATELADALGVSLSTVRRMTRDGQIPVVRLRGAVRYDLEAVVREREAEAGTASRHPHRM